MQERSPEPNVCTGRRTAGSYLAPLCLQRGAGGREHSCWQTLVLIPQVSQYNREHGPVCSDSVEWMCVNPAELPNCLGGNGGESEHNPIV